MNTAEQTDTSTTAPATPSLWARVRAKLMPGALDRRIAGGTDPWSEPKLAARTEILLRRTTRRRIAEGIETAVATANASAYDERPIRLTPIVPNYPPAVPAASIATEPLVDLALRLRSPEPVAPRGVAIARELLVDGGGLLHGSGGADALAAAAHQALDALDAHPSYA